MVKGNGEKIFRGMVEELQRALEHDVALGIGNDSAMTYLTHYDFWRELEAWTMYGGLSRAHVLNVTTQGNADMLGLTSKGRIEPGKEICCFTCAAAEGGVHPEEVELNPLRLGTQHSR